jgi:hypothetical protein
VMRGRRFVLARVDRFSFSVTHRPSVVDARKRVRENCGSIRYNFLNACSGVKNITQREMSQPNAPPRIVNARFC